MKKIANNEANLIFLHEKISNSYYLLLSRSIVIFNKKI